ncbi:MAG: 23S rRNA (uracil(1939)-C(5))-methyltransferase RlmD [Ruminococcaceae bacterium]|nr:23S rRNA (uracil(1939)-C(5))-methyltransferase RlmD [Oscillospiraceae bacterium]
MKKSIPVKKNSIYKLTATGLSKEGHGIGKIDGFTVFCPGLLPGETAKVLVIKVLSSYAIGKISDLTEISPDRITPTCPAYKHCGGCTLGHLSYEAQLKYKEQQVKDCMERIGGLKDFTILPIVGCETTKGFRNKAQYRFTEMNGQLKCGFFKEHSHNVVATESCEIEQVGVAKIRQAVCEISTELKYDIYNEKTGKGLLRGLLIRASHFTGKFMVALICNGFLPQKEIFAKRLMTVCPEVISVFENINTTRGNTVTGEHFTKISGEDFITDNIGPAVFKMGPESFFQVNPLQTEKLYELAAEYSGADENTSLLDLYCGVGTIGIYIAKTRGVKEIFGVEYVEGAIRNAKVNAELNGVENCTFLAGDTGKILSEQGPSFAPDVIVVDPPRKGCDAVALEQVAALKPGKIVYVSCNPATLARDCKILEGLGYKCEIVRPVDMFPQSGHVETVVLLSCK